METYFQLKLWFFIIGICILLALLVGIGISGIIRKIKKAAQGRKAKK